MKETIGIQTHQSRRIVDYWQQNDQFSEQKNKSQTSSDSKTWEDITLCVKTNLIFEFRFQ